MSLIELLAAMALGSLLAALALGLFDQVLRAQAIQTEQYSQQASARAVMAIIGEEWRAAGSRACAAAPITNYLIVDAPRRWRHDLPGISAYEGGQGPAVDRGALVGTDSFAVRYASSAQLISSTAPGELRTRFKHGFKKGEALLATSADCAESVLFEAQSVSSNRVYHSQLNFQDRPGGWLQRYEARVYFVRGASSLHPLSLSRIRLRRGRVYTEELLRGVSDLQALYLVDSDQPADGRADRYVNGSQLSSMALGAQTHGLELSVRLLSPAYLGQTVSQASSQTQTATWLTFFVAMRNGAVLQQP